MRLPNGYGSVYKLSGNRRKPWAARKTVGFNDKGQPIYIYVGYYKTRGEALQGLAEYNGYNLFANPSTVTLRALYERNEGETFGVVLCNIYRSLPLQRIKIGRKKKQLRI